MGDPILIQLVAIYKNIATKYSIVKFRKIVINLVFDRDVGRKIFQSLYLVTIRSQIARQKNLIEIIGQYFQFFL